MALRCSWRGKEQMVSLAQIPARLPGRCGWSAGGARSKIWRGGEQEPPLAIYLVFCPLGSRDVLQGPLSVVFNLHL